MNKYHATHHQRIARHGCRGGEAVRREHAKAARKRRCPPALWEKKSWKAQEVQGRKREQGRGKAKSEGTGFAISAVRGFCLRRWARGPVHLPKNRAALGLLAPQHGRPARHFLAVTSTAAAGTGFENPASGGHHQHGAGDQGREHHYHKQKANGKKEKRGRGQAV